MISKKKCISSLLLAIFLNLYQTTYAATSTAADEQDINQTIQHINQRTTNLEQQIADLKKQVRQLKTAAKLYQQQLQQNTKISKNNNNNSQRSLLELPFDMRPVVVAPYYGVDAEAVVVTPTYNQDVKMLQQRQILENQYAEHGIPAPPTPLIELSGRLEAQAYAQSAKNVVDLTGAELDFASQFNPWVIGFAAFAYDNSPTSPYKISNSRIYLDRGFITVGNLNRTPFYGTLGQRYVPFGQYNTFMVSAPLTQVIGRTNARSALVGYQHTGNAGIYTSLYAFAGDSHESRANNVINNYGATLGYEISGEDEASDFGVDFIHNIADSQGMQGANGGEFEGFGENSSTETLNHLVPGVDVHGKLRIKPITFLAEYTGALRAFSPANLTYQSHGAKPRAINLEAGYNFNIDDIGSSFALGYTHSYDALALNIPLQSYAATLNVSLWKNTIESIELRHSINYPTSAIATGQGMVITTTGNHIANSAILRFGVYF